MASKVGAVAKGKNSKQTEVKNTKLMQNDLRRMMKEKQAASAVSKKIDSPLAKYNNLDQLFCILCNTKIKNELLWTAHVNSKGHKENLLKLKKNDKVTNSSSSNQTTNSSSQILKRSHPVLDNGPPVKKTKVDSKTVENSTPKQRQLRVSFSMSEDEEENDETTETKSELPADFFDVEMKSSPATTTTTTTTTATPVVKSNSKKEIPEGFFDDPVADAKVRKVEYKDPMDEEWDKFQKVISEASSVSQNMMDENDEDMKTEREIDEIDEQIHNWARVEALQRRKDETRKDTEVTSTDAEMEETPLEDDEVDDLLNWRSKDAWR